LTGLLLFFEPQKMPAQMPANRFKKEKRFLIDKILQNGLY